MAFVRVIVAYLVTAFVVPAFAAEPRLQDVIASVTADFNEDGWFDRAILVQDEDGSASLMVFLSKADASSSSAPMTLALRKEKLVFSGPLFGQVPDLAVAPKGALLVSSRNLGIGRDKWEQKLTIVYRKPDFLIAGVTYDSFDGLDPKNAHRCDVNLLTGTSIRDGKTTKGAPRTMRVAEWGEDMQLPECRF